MKKNITAFLILAALVTSASAADQGFYVGANIGQSDSSYAGAKSPTAFTISGGYKFLKNLAVEALYGDFGELAPTGSMKPSGFSIAAVGIWPFNEEWSAFGKLGAATIDTKLSGTGIGADGTYTKTNVTFGIGGQYNFTPALGLRFGVDRYKTGGSQGIWTLTDGDLDFYSVGVSYMF